MAEGAPLLREYGSKAHRGFESLSLRHKQTRPSGGFFYGRVTRQILNPQVRQFCQEQNWTAAGSPKGEAQEVPSLSLSLRPTHHHNRLIQSTYLFPPKVAGFFMAERRGRFLTLTGSTNLPGANLDCRRQPEGRGTGSAESIPLSPPHTPPQPFNPKHIFIPAQSGGFFYGGATRQIPKDGLDKPNGL